MLVVCTLTLSIFPVADWMLYPLETLYKHNPQLPEKVDGIIVLGGSIIPQSSVEWQQLETNEFNERLSSFIELAKQHPEAKLVFSGGSASIEKGHPTEAQIAKSYFLRSGISAERLFIENQSRNTEENVIFSKHLLNPLENETWVMITTAFHTPRAMGIFCKQNWQVIPYPVDHHTLPSQLYSPGFSLLDHTNQLVMASHEWAGLAAYYLTGKTNSLIPGECNYSN